MAATTSTMSEYLSVIGDAAWRPLLVVCATHLALYLPLRRMWHGWVVRTGSVQGSVPDLVAYNTVVLLFDAYACYMALTAYANGDAAAISSSARERLYGSSDSFSQLCIATAAFEAYNTVVCSLLIPELRTVAFVTHHIMTFLLATLSFSPAYCHYYGFFFFGASQISSLPLCAFNALAPLRERYNWAHAPHDALRAAFAVLFILCRVVVWPIISFGFWRDSLAAISEAWALDVRVIAVFM